MTETTHVRIKVKTLLRLKSMMQPGEKLADVIDRLIEESENARVLARLKK